MKVLTRSFTGSLSYLSIKYIINAKAIPGVTAVISKFKSKKFTSFFIVRNKFVYFNFLRHDTATILYVLTKHML